MLPRLAVRSRRPVQRPKGIPIRDVGAFQTWDLVAARQLCVHTTIRGRPHLYLTITSFDGPTMDRLLKIARGIVPHKG
jgi:hypothetical protein